MGCVQWIVLLKLLLIGELQARIESFPHGFDSAIRNETQVYGYQLVPQYQDSTSQSEVLKHQQQSPHIHFVNLGSQLSHNQPRYIPQPQLGSREIDFLPQVPVYQQNLQTRGPDIFQRQKVKSSYQQRVQRNAPNYYQDPHPQVPNLYQYSGLQANTDYRNPQHKAPKHYEQLPTQEPVGHIGTQKPEYSGTNYEKISLPKMPSIYQRHEAHGHYQRPESQVQIYQESPSYQPSKGYQKTQPQAPSHYQELVPEPQLFRRLPRPQPRRAGPRMPGYQKGTLPKSPSHQLRPQEHESQVPAYQQRPLPHQFHAPRYQPKNQTRAFGLEKRTRPQIPENKHSSRPLKHGLQQSQPQSPGHYQKVLPQKPGPHGYEQNSQFQAPSHQQRLHLQMAEHQDQGYQAKSQFQAPSHQPVQQMQSLMPMNQRNMQSNGQTNHQNPDPQMSSYQQNPQLHMLNHQNGRPPQKSMPQASKHYKQHRPQKSEPYKTGHRQNFGQGPNYQQWPEPQKIIGDQQWPLTQRSKGSSYQQPYLPQRSQSYRHGYKQNPSSQMSINQQRPLPYRSDNQQNWLKTHPPNNQEWGRHHKSGSKFQFFDPVEERRVSPG